jgi:hypothetical protein
MPTIMLPLTQSFRYEVWLRTFVTRTTRQVSEPHVTFTPWHPPCQQRTDVKPLYLPSWLGDGWGEGRGRGGRCQAFSKDLWIRRLEQGVKLRSVLQMVTSLSLFWHWWKHDTRVKKRDKSSLVSISNPFVTMLWSTSNVFLYHNLFYATQAQTTNIPLHLF